MRVVNFGETGRPFEIMTDVKSSLKSSNNYNVITANDVKLYQMFVKDFLLIHIMFSGVTDYDQS